MRFERVLALSPHTDDAELGAGGTIARLVEEEAEVYLIAFSVGSAKQAEFVNAGIELGVKWADVYEFETRHFPRDRQDILGRLVEWQDRLSPDLVLCPSSYDFHQDHEVIHAEALRAFRTTTILGYESPWSCRGFDAQCLVRLEQRHITIKTQAVACYESQAQKGYAQILWNLARVRGAQGATEYAEAFEVIRWTMRQLGRIGWGGYCQPR